MFILFYFIFYIAASVLDNLLGSITITLLYVRHEILIQRKQEPLIHHQKSVMQQTFKLAVFPALNIKAIEQYPFTLLELEANFKQQTINSMNEIKSFRYSKSLASQAFCLNASETAEKNYLQIDCHYRGNKWPALVPQPERFTSYPTTNIQITFKLSTLVRATRN
ncbi:hypothetical protein [Aliikangiella maris]|uniref:Uncharacterized protein n=2 Tax=Aliikangiella maris TaxID=3162458 RepID=A0ABV3MLB4_9GAMM